MVAWAGVALKFKVAEAAEIRRMADIKGLTRLPNAATQLLNRIVTHEVTPDS
jgi:hypothetical protein